MTKKNQAAETPEETKKNRFSSKMLVVGGFLVVIIILVAFSSLYFYGKYQDAQKLLNNPKVSGQQDVKALIDKVSRLMELPSEVPTIATVSDKEKLADQAFFVKAENGDRVLIYNTAKKAILYRPSTNKIIEVSNVNISEPTQAQDEPEASPAASVQPKVVLLNGTTKAGLTRTAETKLKADKVNVIVSDRDDAATKDYEETVVIDLTGKNKAVVADIVESLSAKTGSLPKGETAPKNIDILVILGTDYIN